MKLLVFALISLSTFSSYALTKGQFLGRQLVVNISSANYDGTIDGSPQALFSFINRPEQDSFMGRGKVLDFPQKMLNFMCADRGENKFQCSIYIHSSNIARIAPGKASFVVEGDWAKHLFDQFLSNGVRFQYKNEEQTFLIDSTPQKFTMIFDEKGV